MVIPINVALRTSTTAHAGLTEFATPFDPSLPPGHAKVIWGLATAKGHAALSAESARQAGVIG
jgi:hypothetical protein